MGTPVNSVTARRRRVWPPSGRATMAQVPASPLSLLDTLLGPFRRMVAWDEPWDVEDDED